MSVITDVPFIELPNVLNVDNFNRLHDVGTAHDYFVAKQKSDEILCELRNCILKHGLHDIVAIQLLHRHSSLKDQQCVFHYIDHTNKQLISENGSYDVGKMVPYMFQAVVKNVGASLKVEYHAVEFAVDVEIPISETSTSETPSMKLEHLRFMDVKKRLSMLRSKQLFLSEFASILSKYDICSLIGLSLCILPISMHNNITSSTILMERENSSHQLVVTPESKDELKMDEVIITRWEFQSNDLVNPQEPITVGCMPIYGCIQGPFSGDPHRGRAVVGHSVS